jgi:hypothetical protein
MPPLEHYVSQVHLKNFYLPLLADRMFAMRKSDLKLFTPNAQSVCRTEDGSSNAYLKEPRLIEEFLKSIEPKYNQSLQKLYDDSIDQEAIYVIAGFISFVKTCSPAAIRIHSRMPEAASEELLVAMEKRGELPVPPEELAGRSIADILSSKDIVVKVDPKYPQALGIIGVIRSTQLIGNCAWEILVNPFKQSLFFTSDYPIAIEVTPDPRVINHIVPLSPFLAVRVLPDISLPREPLDFSFKKFRCRKRILSPSELTSLNRLIVQCAEDNVFYREEVDWVKKFIMRNRNYRIETVLRRFSGGDGTLLWFREQITKISQFEASEILTRKHLRVRAG